MDSLLAGVGTASLQLVRAADGTAQLKAAEALREAVRRLCSAPASVTAALGPEAPRLGRLACTPCVNVLMTVRANASTAAGSTSGAAGAAAGVGTAASPPARVRETLFEVLAALASNGWMPSEQVRTVVQATARALQAQSDSDEPLLRSAAALVSALPAVETTTTTNTAAGDEGGGVAVGALRQWLSTPTAVEARAAVGQVLARASEWMGSASLGKDTRLSWARALLAMLRGAVPTSVLAFFLPGLCSAAVRQLRLPPAQSSAPLRACMHSILYALLAPTLLAPAVPDRSASSQSPSTAVAAAAASLPLWQSPEDTAWRTATATQLSRMLTGVFPVCSVAELTPECVRLAAALFRCVTPPLSPPLPAALADTLLLAAGGGGVAVGAAATEITEAALQALPLYPTAQAPSSPTAASTSAAAAVAASAAVPARSVVAADAIRRATRLLAATASTNTSTSTTTAGAVDGPSVPLLRLSASLPLLPAPLRPPLLPPLIAAFAHRLRLAPPSPLPLPTLAIAPLTATATSATPAAFPGRAMAALHSVQDSEAATCALRALAGSEWGGDVVRAVLDARADAADSADEPRVESLLLLLAALARCRPRAAAAAAAASARLEDDDEMATTWRGAAQTVLDEEVLAMPSVTTRRWELAVEALAEMAPVVVPREWVRDYLAPRAVPPLLEARVEVALPALARLAEASGASGADELLATLAQPVFHAVTARLRHVLLHPTAPRTLAALLQWLPAAFGDRSASLLDDATAALLDAVDACAQLPNRHRPLLAALAAVLSAVHRRWPPPAVTRPQEEAKASVVAEGEEPSKEERETSRDPEAVRRFFEEHLAKKANAEPSEPVPQPPPQTTSTAEEDESVRPATWQERLALAAVDRAGHFLAGALEPTLEAVSVVRAALPLLEQRVDMARPALVRLWPALVDRCAPPSSRQLESSGGGGGIIADAQAHAMCACLELVTDLAQRTALGSFLAPRLASDLWPALRQWLPPLLTHALSTTPLAPSLQQTQPAMRLHGAVLDMLVLLLGSGCGDAADALPAAEIALHLLGRLHRRVPDQLATAAERALRALATRDPDSLWLPLRLFASLPFPSHAPPLPGPGTGAEVLVLDATAFEWPSFLQSLVLATSPPATDFSARSAALYRDLYEK